MPQCLTFEIYFYYFGQYLQKFVFSARLVILHFVLSSDFQLVVTSLPQSVRSERKLFADQLT